MSKKRIVIKVGTNVLQSRKGKLDYNLIRDLAEQIASLLDENYEILFVSSGAVGAGQELHPTLRTQIQGRGGRGPRIGNQSFSDPASHPMSQKMPWGKDSILREQMMAAVGQVRLMQIYSDFFLEHQIVIAQVLVTRSDFGNRTAWLNIRNTLEGLLKIRVLPIINENDVVATEELAPQFGDNDQLAVFVSALISADALFYLTNTSGLLRGSDLIETVTEVNDEILSYCDTTIATGAKGGMLSKVKAAGMAMSFGMDTYILSGKSYNAVSRILAGERIGTHFVSQGKKVRSYRKWLATGVMGNGRLTIDAGAENALQNKKSLLAAGVTEISGNFQTKDLVTIYNQSDVKIGVGRINLSSEELKQRMLEQPPSRSLTVIHRDHLVLVDPSLSS